MTLRSMLLSGAAFATLAAPAAALTADETWANQIGYLADLGFVTEATPVRDGATTVMTDVSTVWTVPMGMGTVTITSPDITMTENGDGSVSITYPDKFRVQMNADLSLPTGSGSALLEFGVRLEDQSMTATGTANEVTYAARSGLLDIALDRIKVEEEGVSGVDTAPVEFFVTIQDYVTDTTIGSDGQVTTISSVNTTGLSVFEFSLDAGFSGLTTTVGSVDTTTSTTTLMVPAGPVDWLNLSTALRNGLSLSTQTESTNSRQQTVTTMDGQMMSDQSQTLATQAQTLTISADGLALDGIGTGLSVSISDQMMLPFPIAVSVGEAGGRIALPLLAEADPQDFALGVTLRDVTVPEDLWAFVDAGGVLPRDPATVVLDISGQVVSRVDMLDLMAWEGVANQIDQGQIPVDIMSLSIDTLNASAIGAALTATGAFTFDNADRTTFPGFPRPQGEATAQMTGLYAALDRLSQIGVLPMEAGMGARGAIGMFATATGEDQLSTTLSIGPDGTITVNGMPIPMP